MHDSCKIRQASSVRYFFDFFFAFFAFFAPFFAAFFLATVNLLTEPTSDRLAAGLPGYYSARRITKRNSFPACQP
jgi:hypothetical protein